MNRLRIFLIIAFRNLIQARRRTLLLSVAIAAVTMLLVLLMSLSQGVNDNLIRSATTLSAGHVNVSGFFKATIGDAAPILDDRATIRTIVEQNTPGLDYVIDRQRGWVSAITPSGALQTGLAGIDIDDELHFPRVVQLALESAYREGGQDVVLGDVNKLREPNTAVIFEGQARRLGVTVGDAITFRSQTYRGITNTVDATVVAVARDIGLLSNFTIFVPKQTVLELYQLSDKTTGGVLIYLKDIKKAEETMGHLRQVFEERGYDLMDHQPEPFFAKFNSVAGEDWTGQKIDMTTWEDEVSFLTWILTALDTISFFLITILAIIIAIGIMNTMWISVRERTRELGTVRAMGMTRRDVLLLFMLEATMLGAFASLVGGLFGAALASAISAATIPIPLEAVRAILLSDTLHLAVNIQHLVLSILAMTLVTGLSALWPSSRAARLQPVQAMQNT
ncbi:MAG: ABC transporter permease [Bradymonadaceae bacterium]|nr:ABC transporter permease [Lujinxingiaceae bacterium]